ncbi:MAG: alpha/beta fold hydrolase [Betaproteobacteria bacterium]|nr:alpha/beta fold hydrolase [Betaproteobacteria bacterium]NBS46613.1 alpha/beta fold hydrolase [Betaproteobacteria bacterium]
MYPRLHWDSDGRDWPWREHSRFVDAHGLRWHVQRFAAPADAAPRALLLHGTGASTHSWRDVIPWLQRDFELLSLDLPGHAFTSMPVQGMASLQLSLPGMADAVAQLLRELDFIPDLVIGHSAGAAVGARLCLSSGLPLRLLVSLNGALLPLGGLAGAWFSPIARLMALAPGVPRLFAWRASDPKIVRRLIDSTGSRIDDDGLRWYLRLASNPGHAAGALGMMANWDLYALRDQLAQVRCPVSLIAGSNDLTVPPGESDKVQAMLSGRVPCDLTRLQGLGHLAHEEQPEAVAALITARWLSARAP